MTDQTTGDPTHGLSVQHADALWDAVAIPGPTEPTFPMQHERVCRAVAGILDELRTPPAVPVSSPPPDQTADRAADRAAVLREAAHDLATAFGDPKVKHIGAIAASHLRRRARELEGRETDEEQPETPLEKRLRYSERRNDELRTECKRRGKRVLEQSEKIIALEKQLDEVRTQLGAEILRAGQAEAELRRLAAEAPQPETPNTDRAAVYREVADRLTTDAHGMQPDWARIYKRDAAVKVREWADRLDGEGAPTKKLPAS